MKKIDHEAAVALAYKDGYTTGHSHGYEKGVSDSSRKKMEIEERELLKALTAYASATGQTMDAISRVFQSLRNQL